MTTRPPLTIVEFGRQLRSGATSARAAASACLNRIAAENAALNAFITVMADEARRDAAAADEELAVGRDRGPLHGVPVSIKDLFDVRGTATTAASRVREGHIAPADATAIVRLRQAGAVIVGKTNLHEFAFGTTNEDSAFGPARNPHDRSRSPGGSSGGSAVSLVAGMALGTLGTDTGGSIRIPAAACGVVGLKPSYGEIPTDGVVPLSRSLDHAGPLALTVADARLLFHALRGAAAPRPPLTREALRLAVPREYFCGLLDDEVRAGFERVIGRLRESGSVVEDVSIDHAPLTPTVYLHISFAEAAAYHAHTLETMPERYTTAVRLRLEMARYVLAEDYVRAMEGRSALSRAVDRSVSGYDALVLPTLPIPAPELGAETMPVGTALGTSVGTSDGTRREPVRSLMLRLTQLFNLTGHPAISLPFGATARGLPLALQLVGHRNATDALLDVAEKVESALSAQAADGMHQ